MNSIIIGDTKDQCFICQRWGQTEEHHMIHGTAGRKKAEKYGLKVHLCHDCHMKLHDKGKFDRALQYIAQENFEKNFGHEEWMKVFEKNYFLEEEQWKKIKPAEPACTETTTKDTTTCR